MSPKNETLRTLSIVAFSFLMVANAYTIWKSNYQIDRLIEINQDLSMSLEQSNKRNRECLNVTYMFAGRIIQHTGDHEIPWLESIMRQVGQSICDSESMIKGLKE